MPPTFGQTRVAYLIVVWLVSPGLGSNLEGCRLDRGCVYRRSQRPRTTARWTYFEDLHRR
jgi:hypothetical protein